MTERHESAGSRETFSEVLAVDRALDAIGRGQASASDVQSDALLGLLASARAETDAGMPAAPDVSQVPEGVEWTGAEWTSAEWSSAECAEDDHSAEPEAWGRKRALRRGVSALAAGGASATAMIIAGGMAAALAVGGLGYAAYTTTQTKLSEESSEVQGRGEGSEVTSPAPQRPTSPVADAAQSEAPQAGEGEQAVRGQDSVGVSDQVAISSPVGATVEDPALEEKPTDAAETDDALAGSTPEESPTAPRDGAGSESGTPTGTGETSTSSTPPPTTDPGGTPTGGTQGQDAPLSRVADVLRAHNELNRNR